MCLDGEETGEERGRWEMSQQGSGDRGEYQGAPDLSSGG